MFERGYFIYNIPGGKSVTLGGAISGNVHGRISTKFFSTFGDNILSITVLKKNLKLKKLTKKSISFFDIIGGMGIFQTIISAEIKVCKLKNECFSQNENHISSYSEYENFFKKESKFYGFLNLANKNFEGIFYNEILIKQKLQKNNFGKPLNIKRFKIFNFISYFLNSISLKIIYKLFFYFKRKRLNPTSIVKFGEILYPTSLINILPVLFKSGMIELQFSINPKKFIKFYNNLINLSYRHNFYFYYFLIKKMHKARNNYFTNFPKYNLSISISFSKSQYLKNKIFFEKFSTLFNKYNCNIYVTKDEVLLKNYKRKLINKYKKNKKFANQQISTMFKEKLIK